MDQSLALTLALPRGRTWPGKGVRSLVQYAAIADALTDCGNDSREHASRRIPRAGHDCSRLQAAFLALAASPRMLAHNRKHIQQRGQQSLFAVPNNDPAARGFFPDGR
jgi:hypothetical protein